MLADVVDRADVRMIQRRGRARLALEALDGDRVCQQPRREELDGDLPAEPRVFGAVDDTHAAFADLVNDPVVRDSLADHWPAKLPIVGCGRVKPWRARRVQQ